MNNQTLFLIIIVLVLIYFLPNKNRLHINRPQADKINIIDQDQNQDLQQPQSQPQAEPQSQPQAQITKTNKKSKKAQQNELTQELIGDYLTETNCKEKSVENFNTMGNNMKFNTQVSSNLTDLDKKLANSLVPDFEPSYLNISPGQTLNSFGYATNNQESDQYYENRGFMNPTDGHKYADSVQWMLAHPFQTRYCSNKN